MVSEYGPLSENTSIIAPDRAIDWKSAFAKNARKIFSFHYISQIIECFLSVDIYVSKQAIQAKKR